MKIWQFSTAISDWQWQTIEILKTIASASFCLWDHTTHGSKTLCAQKLVHPKLHLYKHYSAIMLVGMWGYIPQLNIEPLMSHSQSLVTTVYLQINSIANHESKCKALLYGHTSLALLPPSTVFRYDNMKDRRKWEMYMQWTILFSLLFSYYFCTVFMNRVASFTVFFFFFQG